MQSLWQDIRYGLRTLRNNFGFTMVAIFMLALGIGANTAIFSVINAMILNPPHLAEAERLTAIWRTTKDKRTEGYASYLEMQDWRAQNQSFEAIGAYKPNGYIVQSDEQAERLDGMRVTANFLSLLKISPQLGRDFREEEEKRGAQPVTIISHRFWQTRLGGDAGIIGQPLTLSGKSFTIIGILPADFEFPLAAKQ